jgi:short chain dehydrogenase
MPAADGVIAPGRVAVVTGAASGIGLGLCQRFVAEGMSVVMADVEEPALTEACTTLASQGGTVLAVPTDVSSAEQVAALRQAAVAEFGAVHVLCNNAGVGGSHGLLWQIPAGDWEWVLRVNLGGVINGIRAFVPLLAEQDAAHVVNTAVRHLQARHCRLVGDALLPVAVGRPARRRGSAVPGSGADPVRVLGAEPAGVGRAPGRRHRAGARECGAL